MRVSALLILLLAGLVAQAQPAAPAPPKYADFAALLARLHERDKEEGDFGRPPVLYQDNVQYGSRHFKTRIGAEIRLADRSLGLQTRVVPLHNPAGNGYPLAYSVIYQGCLVALFEPGGFACFRLEGLGMTARNQLLEGRLNARKFLHHWLIGQRLVALAPDKQYYAFDLASQSWQPYQQPVPFGISPKLYEDEKYLVYSTCSGEFGGTAFFYNKQTKATHRADATCANAVWKEADGYHLLASLGQEGGAARAARIPNPEALPLANALRNPQQDWQYTLADSVPDPNITPTFRISDAQVFGGFRGLGQTLYYVYWHSTVFLATIVGGRITVVDPLFADYLYAHEPATTAYGPDLTLTSLDFYKQAAKQEVAALLLQGRQLTKIVWEQPKPKEKKEGEEEEKK